jgi:hypothetical protein
MFKIACKGCRSVEIFTIAIIICADSRKALIICTMYFHVISTAIQVIWLCYEIKHLNVLLNGWKCSDNTIRWQLNKKSDILFHWNLVVLIKWLKAQWYIGNSNKLWLSFWVGQHLKRILPTFPHWNDMVCPVGSVLVLNYVCERREESLSTSSLHPLF